MKDSTTVILIFSILALHFLAGVGYMLYKIFGSGKSKDQGKGNQIEN